MFSCLNRPEFHHSRFYFQINTTRQSCFEGQDDGGISNEHILKAYKTIADSKHICQKNVGKPWKTIDSNIFYRKTWVGHSDFIAHTARRVPQPNQSRSGARWRSNSPRPQGRPNDPMKILLIQNPCGKYDKIRRDVEGFLVNFQAFDELFLSKFLPSKFIWSHSRFHSIFTLWDHQKPGFSEFLQKMWRCWFSHDFHGTKHGEPFLLIFSFFLPQLPATPPYSADSAKPCRAAAGRVCAKRLELFGENLGFYQRKWGFNMI